MSASSLGSSRSSLLSRALITCRFDKLIEHCPLRLLVHSLSISHIQAMKRETDLIDLVNEREWDPGHFG